jgi:Uma2 family endonuclease
MTFAMHALGRYPVREAMETGVRPPPRGEDLPYSDGEPMESDRHVRQMMMLITTLEDAWRERDDFFVAGNMFVYNDRQIRSNDFRGPDVFVVLDVESKGRKSWVAWQEGGRLPDVVIEVTSESTAHVDRGEKMRNLLADMA